MSNTFFPQSFALSLANTEVRTYFILYLHGYLQLIPSRFVLGKYIQSFALSLANTEPFRARFLTDSLCKTQENYMSWGYNVYWFQLMGNPSIHTNKAVLMIVVDVVIVEM